MKIALISCVSKKDKDAEHTPVPAYKLYTSALFRKAYAYAKNHKPDRIYILSAKYGLLNEIKKVKAYNQTLNNMSAIQRKAWAQTVLNQIKSEGIDLEKDEFIILAGRKYRENLLGPGKIVHYKNVYEENNLHGIGCILKFLSDDINE